MKNRTRRFRAPLLLAILSLLLTACGGDSGGGKPTPPPPPPGEKNYTITISPIDDNDNTLAFCINSSEHCQLKINDGTTHEIKWEKDSPTDSFVIQASSEPTFTPQSSKDTLTGGCSETNCTYTYTKSKDDFTKLTINVET